MDRRAFLRTLPAVSGGLAASGAAAGCAGATYLSPTRGPGTVSVDLAEAEAAPWALVELAGSSRPLLLLRDGEGTWRALLARCTHRGCQPDPVGDRLVCPCHGSEFSLRGEVLEGPAERPLRSFPVRREGDRLVVAVGEGS